MNSLEKFNGRIPAMTPESIKKVRDLEEIMLAMPQEDLKVSHFLHAGIYIRTVRIPSGSVITGALLKIPTILIVSGEVIVYVGDRTVTLTGYNVFPAEANRKQVFLTKSDTFLTAMFATNAKTVEEAEKESTYEFGMLTTNRDKRPS